MKLSSLPKGKTLVKLNIDHEVELISDDSHMGVYNAFQTKQVGSILVAANIRKENAGAFDPVYGEVVLGEHVGKTAWFHKLNYREAKTYGNNNHLFDGEEVGLEEGTYLSIEDSSIFFYTDADGNIEMVPEWTLCEPIGDVTWEYYEGVKVKCRRTTGGLVLPVEKEEYKTDRATIRHIHPTVAEDLGLQVGDVVYLDRACDLPVEDELNMKLGKMFFRVEVCNILGVDTSCSTESFGTTNRSDGEV